MNSLPTRFLCVLLSMAGAAGLVAFASPAVAVGAVAKAPITIIAAAPAPLSNHG